MPRKIEPYEKQELIDMMLEMHNDGTYVYGQREIERQTGFSRKYIREMGKKLGRQFERNGIEVRGQLCMCLSCGDFFRRPPSKVVRAEKQFCSEGCRKDYMKGENHAAWIDGRSVSTFSSFISRTAGYKEWKQAVLERAGHKCEISGRDYDLHCHHIKEKSKHQDLALDVDNGMVLNEDVHREMHKLMHQGLDFDQCVKKLKEKYGT